MVRCGLVFLIEGGGGGWGFETCNGYYDTTLLYAYTSLFIPIIIIIFRKSS